MLFLGGLIGAGLLPILGNIVNSLNLERSWHFGRRFGSFWTSASINYFASGGILTGYYIFFLSTWIIEQIRLRSFPLQYFAAHPKMELFQLVTSRLGHRCTIYRLMYRNSSVIVSQEGHSQRFHSKFCEKFQLLLTIQNHIA